MKKIFNHNIYELFWKLFPAQFFVVVAGSLSNFVNGLIVGNLLNDDALTALGLVTPLVALISAIASIVSGGAGILCGNYMGRGEAKKVNQVYSIALCVLFATGIVLTAACIGGAGILARLFNASEQTFAYTKSYIVGTSMGILAMLIMPCLMTFLQMCNKSGISLLSTILLAVFNIIFNFISIKVFDAGIFGIGVATSLSKYVITILMLLYIRFKKDLVTFDAKLFDLGLTKKMLIIGSPASLANIMYALRNVFINSYALKVAGSLAVNSLTILGSVGGFFDAFNIGVSVTFAMLASVFIGERDSKSLKDLMKTSAILGIALALGKTLVAYVLNERIPMLYGATGDLAHEAARLLEIYCWSAPFNMITCIMIGTFQNLGRVTFCNLMYFCNCLLVPFICCSVLTKFMGIDAIWWCYALAEIVTLSLFYLTSCLHKKGLVKNVDELIYLPDDFDTENRMSISIDSIDEVVMIARNIERFCKDHGIDARRSMLAGLCMEEMAGNVVDHGFKKDNKKNSIDVFACVENDEVYLRLRDDCVPFDPHTKLQMVSDDDPIKNVGIKMVSKLAKEMNYQSTFGMNVLTIRL